MALDYLFAVFITPAFGIMLLLLLFPSFLTSHVISFLQASILINNRSFRVVHILLLASGLNFLSKVNGKQNSEFSGDYDLLPIDAKVSIARLDRDLYIAAVAFFSVLYTWRLAGVVGDYLKVVKAKK